MKIEKVNIKQLISPDYNPRTITSAAMESLKQSINEFGYITPIIVNRYNNHVVGGNQRLQVLKSMGYTTVDVIFIDEPDLNREKALNIRLNNLSGEWDTDKLESILDDLELEEFDVTLTGFDLDDFNIDLENNDYTITEETNYTESIEDNNHEQSTNNKDVPTEITEHEEDTFAGGLNEDDVTVKVGDVYVLGNHRLMCGDSSDKKNIDILLNKEGIDLILTDPPYGINIVNVDGNIGGGKPVTIKPDKSGSVPNPDSRRGGVSRIKGVVDAKKYKPILNDDKPYDPSILLELNVDSIIFGANNFSSKLPDSPKWLVWYKKPMDKKNNDNFSDVELAWTNIKGKMCKLYPYLWSGLLREGRRDLELKERIHPTQKPVGLLINILNDYSKTDDNILDLYGGSGSTLIACEEINRNCFMMELDPYYCQLIINRWEEFTGETAIKIN